MARALLTLGAAALVWASSLHAQSRARRRAIPASGSTQAEQTIIVGGTPRTYLLHDFAQDAAAAPLVIVLHGGGGNAQTAEEKTGFDRVAAREHFVVVYPDGTARSGRGSLAAARSRLLTWNAGHCCAAAMADRVDDVAFISTLIDALAASGRVDRSRVYVTGMSNGAMMTERLGRELSTKIAAIAPVAGAVFGDEPPPLAPMPALIIVGADDQTIPPQGGALQLRPGLGNRSAADRDVAPAIDQAQYWAKYNGCDRPARTATAAWTKTEWTTCRSGAPVVFYDVNHNGHAWPGGRAGRRGADEPTQAFDATEAIWTFFTHYHRDR
ncbi:MAG TPA: PHB depolymerase family esterase [Vicinamibacterales bacterium]|nr:PHB depolymerase family esterase [Vicinamibacterales bacterium]